MPGREDDSSTGAGAEETPVEEADPKGKPEGSRLGRFARRLMDRKDLAEDTKDVLMAVWSTSDRAKSEAVRMVAREVRHYLEELRLKDDLRELMTGYSLEVSLHLKPLPAADAPAPPQKDEKTPSRTPESED